MKKVLKMFSLVLFSMLSLQGWGQAIYPTVHPEAVYITSKGEEINDATDAQSAPLQGKFTSNITDLGDYSVRYEWKIYREGQEKSPIIHRFEENLEYTFVESGSFYIQFYATFVHGNDTIVYPEQGEATPFVVSISESVLEMPNAFSPNDDGYNDIYRAKEGYESIVSFKATIFNRWGQKLYSFVDLQPQFEHLHDKEPTSNQCPVFGFIVPAISISDIASARCCLAEIIRSIEFIIAPLAPYNSFRSRLCPSCK